MAGLVVGGADVGDDEAQHDAQRRRRKGHDQRGLEAVNEEHIALVGDEGGDELAGKLVPHILEK